MPVPLDRGHHRAGAGPEIVVTAASQVTPYRAGEASRWLRLPATTFYKWKAKFGGLEVSDARRLKALEDENRRLKRLLADSLLDNAALKDLLGKNV